MKKIGLLKRITFILTRDCDNSCAFCYEHINKHNINHHILKKEDIIKFVNFIVENYNFDYDFDITFIGGEPMLFKEFSIFFEVFNIFQENKIHINLVETYSNMLTLSNEFIVLMQHISKLGINTRVKTVCNVVDEFPNRIFGNKLTDFYNNIELLKKSVKNIDIRANVCIVDFNMKKHYKTLLENNLKYIIQKQYDKIKQVQFSEYILNYTFSQSDFYFFTNILLNIISIYRKNTNTMCYWYDDMIINKLIESSGLKWISFLLKSKHNEQRIMRHECNPFINEIGISPGGFITPCSKFLDHLNICPNIYDTSLLTKLIKYNSVEIYNKNEDDCDCGKCLLAHDCKGCKINPNECMINNNNQFIYPRNKCQYEFDKFLGQYNALIDYFQRED